MSVVLEAKPRACVKQDVLFQVHHVVLQASEPSHPLKILDLLPTFQVTGFIFKIRFSVALKKLEDLMTLGHHRTLICSFQGAMHGLSSSLQRMFKICCCAFSVSHHLLRGLCYLVFSASFLHSFYTIPSASVDLIILGTLHFVSVSMVKIKHAVILGVGMKRVIIYLCTSFTRT